MTEIKNSVIQWLHNKVASLFVGGGVFSLSAAQLLSGATQVAAFILLIVVIISHWQDILIKRKKLKEKSSK